MWQKKRGKKKEKRGDGAFLPFHPFERKGSRNGQPGLRVSPVEALKGEGGGKEEVNLLLSTSDSGKKGESGPWRSGLDREIEKAFGERRGEKGGGNKECYLDSVEEKKKRGGGIERDHCIEIGGGVKPRT